MKVKQESTIFTVTGTKGKTSVARMLHFVVNKLSEEPVLRVDTNLVVLGEEKQFGLYDSWRSSGFVPTVCPGRFLLLLHGHKHPTAVLEAAVGSSRVGLGYRAHDLGIFTNVYDDHVGMKEYLATRDNLADVKASFIFGKIKKHGVAVYNADDQMVIERLSFVPEERDVYRVACTAEDRSVEGAQAVVRLVDGDIVLSVGSKERARCSSTDYPCMLNCKHLPSIYNTMFVVGALWGKYKDTAVFDRALRILRDYRLDDEGGRMVSYETKDGVRVLVDFAHEKESLRYVALYARSLVEGRVYGVLRLDGSRPLVQVEETGRYISQYFDQCFVYDKEAANDVDSEGLVASWFAESLKSNNVPAAVFSKDEDALRSARKIARKGDAVVYIISSFDKGRSVAQTIFENKENI